MITIKKLTILYFLLLFIGSIILFNICIDLNSVIESYTSISAIDSDYTSLQTRVSIYSISIFIVLLLVSYAIYYIANKLNYIVISNILYVSIILYVYITVNKSFYEIQNIDYSQQGEYWITMFIGVFYVVGAVLVSSIGYLTIRNYSKRLVNSSVKLKRKMYGNF